MSDNHKIIIPAGNPVKKFPSELQELYLKVCEYGEPPINHQKLTEKNLKQLIRKIHKRKVLGAVLSYPDKDEDYFEIEVNPSWIAFEYVVNNGMGTADFIPALTQIIWILTRKPIQVQSMEVLYSCVILCKIPNLPQNVWRILHGQENFIREQHG